MGQSIHRALIVDDEPLIREATSRAMSALAFSCDTAIDGNQALKYYADQRHDLVVTDLRMPNKHGHSLVVELLQQPDPPKIVVLTGVANARLVKDLYSRGIHDIVQKPIDFDVFAMKMLALFEKNNWNPSSSTPGKVDLHGNQHPLVQKVEAAIEIFSMCVPDELDRELRANSDLLNDPPENLLQFLERLTQSRGDQTERRKSDRISVFSTATAIPVNKDFEVQGAASRITINDLSENGICVFHTRSFPTDYVALRWRSLVTPSYCLTAVLQIQRCKPVGPFYEIAGPFVMHD